MLANNPQAAVRWMKAAAQAGFAPAQLVFGQLLLDGREIAGDPEAAFAWFQKAAATGDLEARNMVGRCYEQGWGVAVDHARATESFEIAAQAGHLWAQVNLAQMLMRRGDPKDRPRAFALFKAAAESGASKANLKAMNSLARFLEEGWAGPRDPAGALFWYRKAAKLGDHWAQYNLATILYRKGEVEAADQWLQRAIANSDNGFRRRIAPLLLAQPGAALRRRGLEALQRIAEGGQPGDLYAYGVALENGVAGPPDPAAARMLFKTAAKNGHTEATDRLRAMRSPTKLLAAFARRCRVMRPPR
ncbi:hypothetical protein FBZ90_109244 [Nitrospirillum pindoramense]|uniref:TPR repeat protein n=2 Tax=Nitrospirillum amazonense TaxID=28077 RepID=A0A560H3C1_9PROT|nr:hypothetical protein FBZ90_109244 [Nitrospirillum amazonense]